MEARLCSFLTTLLMFASFAPVTGRTFASNQYVVVNQPVTGRGPEKALLGSNNGIQIEYEQGIKSKEGILNEEAYSKGLSKIGSSPPRCEHKCFGCTPCEAIQVPTTGKTHSHLGVNYANYEPEGWKCKCGPSLYSP